MRAFKYAVAGRTIGLPEGVLLRRAGGQNLATNGADAGAGDPGNGVFGGVSPYGNTADQHAAIQQGFLYYDAQCAEA